MLICCDEIGLSIDLDCIYLGLVIYYVTTQSNEVSVLFAECKSVLKERYSS